MSNSGKILLKSLGDKQFIEIFKLEDIGDSFFENYQRYDFYQIIWFTKVEGDNLYFLDFKEYFLEKDQVILVFPGQIDRLDTKGKEGYLFAVDREVFFRISQHINSDYLNGYFSNVVISLDSKTKDNIEKIVGLLLTEYNDKNRLKLMESYMEAFVFHISALFDNNNIFNNRIEPVVSELMKLIDENFVEHKDTDFYAEKLGLPVRKLNKICIAGTGNTVKQHLQERLVLEIKKEIRLNEKSMKEIAFQLGFSEPAYFTRFFKQQTSLTPGEFRDS